MAANDSALPLFRRRDFIKGLGAMLLNTVKSVPATAKRRIDDTARPLYKIPKGERTVKGATRNDGNVLIAEVCRLNDPHLSCRIVRQNLVSLKDAKQTGSRPKANFCYRSGLGEVAHERTKNYNETSWGYFAKPIVIGSARVV